MPRDRILILSSLLVCMLLVPVGASAQECLLGVYGNPEGTDGPFAGGRDLGSPIWEVDVYYVMRVEDFVRGVAWNRSFVAYPNASYTLELVGAQQHYDPLEQFLEVTENGFRMGLGDCHVGFGQNPIMVLRETLYLEIIWNSAQGKAVPDGQELGYVHLEPNVLEDPEYAVYADCSDEATKHLCSFENPHLIIPARDAQSWGAIKASYR